MENLEIKVIESSLQKSMVGLVTGVVYFDFDNEQFPELSWNDNVVVILGWWLSALMNYICEHAERADLLFMEGPLRVEIYRRDDEFCILKCVYGKERRVMREQKVQVAHLFRKILIAATDIQGACERKGWMNDDIGSLISNISSAKNFISLG